MLDRVYDFQWKTIEKLKNTIEPFANYAYVPNIYQGNQPLFDQVDRLNERSLLTYGVTARLFAKSKQAAPEQTTTDATTTEDVTTTEGVSDTESTVGPFHEDPLATSLAIRATIPGSRLPTCMRLFSRRGRRRSRRSSPWARRCRAPLSRSATTI